MRRLYAAAMVALALAGCVNTKQEPTPASHHPTESAKVAYLTTNVQRIYDPQTKAVCYLYIGPNYRSALSCVGTDELATPFLSEQRRLP